MCHFGLRAAAYCRCQIRLTVRFFFPNPAYLLADKSTMEGVLIDPVLEMARAIFPLAWRLPGRGLVHTCSSGPLHWQQRTALRNATSQVDRDAKLVADLGVTLLWGLNTHMHADHITGTGKLKKCVPHAHGVCPARSVSQTTPLQQ